VKVLDDPGSERPSCRLVSDAFGAVVRVEGLTAPELRARLFERGARWPWHRLVERSPLAIELIEGARHHAAPNRLQKNTAVVERDLTDGLVRLNSGGRSELSVRPDHDDPDALLPSSLYLCFAHQWALAGLLPLHAAAFATNNGGVLAVGDKGTGKSTLTAAALIAGCRVVSDDWLLAQATSSGLVVERLRRFIMLRHGWASEQVKRHLPDLSFRDQEGRPKSIVRLPPVDARFPTRTTVDRMYELSRPRGARTQTSFTEPLSNRQALAALVRSSMPLLFSAALPIEQSLLLESCRLGLPKVVKYRLVPGSAVVTDPSAETARLGLSGEAGMPPDTQQRRP
jgi:hypothetical protein